MGNQRWLQFFRPERAEYTAARARLKAKGKQMNAFLRACLRQLNRDPNGFLVLLAQDWPHPGPQRRQAWQRLAGLVRLAGLLVFPLLATGGFLVGLWVVSFAQAENGSKFTSTPQFRIWSAMAAALVAVAFVVIAYSGRILFTLFRRFPRDAGWVGLLVSYLGLAAIIFGVTAIFGNPNTSVVADYTVPRTVFPILGLLAALPSIMGIWLIGRVLLRMKLQIKDETGAHNTSGTSVNARGPGRKQILSDLILVRAKLLFLLSAVGALIGVTVLATGALRNALLAVKTTGGKAAEYPIEYVLMYGLFFSALLAVIYVPVYFRLQDRSRDYIEMVFPWPDQGHYSNDDYTGRDNLGKLLHIDASVQETLQTGLAIIAPLIASLLSALLPTPK
jgi:hypothetical protein